jgi:DNA/RNA endonuclease YhcR with UshA esterase domain
VFNNGKEILLSFHHPHRGHFKALIPRSAWPQFPGLGTEMGRNRAGLFREGQPMAVTGVLTFYQGDPAIHLESPAQLR